MSDFDSVKNLEKLFRQKSLLDISLEIVGLMDSMDLMVYPHWIDGELVDGPHVSRYWVKVTFKYPFNKMPDPMGARVLHDIGVKIKYEKSVIMQPIEIKTPSDYRPNSKKPKLLPQKVWYVELQIPRRFIDDIDYNELEDSDSEDEIDIKDVVAATDQGMNVDNITHEQDHEII